MLSLHQTPRIASRSAVISATILFALPSAPPARADRDAAFASELHSYGIYGQGDYNAWLAKITCERLTFGVDLDASESAAFLSDNLTRATSTEQVWHFLGAAVARYCPQHSGALTAMAGDPA